MHRFGTASKRAIRGFMMIKRYQRGHVRIMADPDAHRPGERCFTPECVAEAEARKERAKDQERAKSRRMRQSCG